MRGVKSLNKALQSQSAIFAGCEARQTAPLINVAACLYSSATSPAHSIPDVRGRDPRASHYILPQQQLTSLLAFPQARCFNSGDDTQASSSATDFVDDAAESESDFGPSAILNAVAGVEEDAWLAAREDVWFFNRYMQTVLRFAQETTGLPWWETIAITTLVFRTLTIPFHIQSVRNTYNMTKARPQVEQLAAQLKQEQENKNPKAMEQYQRKLAEIWKRNNCHPVKSILPILVQAPVFIGFFSSLRSMAEAKIPSLMEGGISWFTDLTVADTTFLLPAMAFGVFLLSAELGGADGMQGQPPHVIQRFKWTMRVLTVIMVPFSKGLPASVFIYWVTSNTWTFLQSMVLRQAAVKRYLGFPIATPKPGSNPTLTAVQPLGHAAGGQPIQTFAKRPTVKPKDRR